MASKFVIMTALLMIIAGLTAHPASRVNAVWDADTSTLRLNFDHKVNNAADHYIYEVVVELNGRKIIEQKTTLQDSNEGGSLLYRIPGTKKGDRIRVVTDCNKGGKRAATITIP